MPLPNFSEVGNSKGWQAGIKSWINARWKDCNPISDDIVSFFEIAFENTRCPSRAWFGVHQRAISLVIGGNYLAAIHYGKKQDSGLWLTVDKPAPEIEGFDYRHVKRTKDLLVWMHSESLLVIPKIIANDLLWQSFASASEKILSFPVIAADRDSEQRKYGKKRLSEFWSKHQPINLFPEEVEDDGLIWEGAKYQVTINAYERNPRAREQCIEHHGMTCFTCGFSFKAVYGEVAARFIHVHHLRPLSEIGSEYKLDPVKDLIPVCPNCHAVFHLRKPPFTTEEVMELLHQRQVSGA